MKVCIHKLDGECEFGYGILCDICNRYEAPIYAIESTESLKNIFKKMKEEQIYNETKQHEKK